MASPCIQTGLQGSTYEERLVELGKILRGVDNVDKKTWFTQVPEERAHRTRATEGGHSIVRTTSRSELRRHFFSQRVAEKWNELPLQMKMPQQCQASLSVLRRAKQRTELKKH